MQNLLDCSLPELEALVASLGEPKFRAAQLFQWLWQKGAAELSAMTNLSKAFRARLAEAAGIVQPVVAEVRTSSDGTAKFLLSMADGALVETVLIPEGDHYTQCLSTQAGCPMGCTFCATGGLGFERNLTQSEIAGQVLVTRAWLAEKGDPVALRNIVFMGMGEPLLNTENLYKTLTTMGSDLGLSFATRRLTVSTSGIPGEMIRFGRSGLGLLAVSLHAPTQELREQIMPRAARLLPLAQLIEELKGYPLKPRERLTMEYLLLDGVNDSPALARELVRLLSPLKAKVNLIAYNASDQGIYRAPSLERVLAFQKVLRDKNLTATLRKSKGADIRAACGQLAAEGRRQAVTQDR